MDNKTTFEIIQETENAPFVIKKISSDFLAIETHYNSVITSLENEKMSIDTKYSNSISSLKKQHKQQIENERTNWENGFYVNDIANQQIKAFEESIQKSNIIKWVITIIGVIILFNRWFYDIDLIPYRWYYGVLLIGLGQWIMNTRIESIRRKITTIKNISSKEGRSYDQQDRTDLKRITSNLQQKINQKGGWEKTRINKLETSLENKFKEFEKNQTIEKDQKQNEQELKRKTTTEQLLIDSNKNIQTINTLLKHQLSSLNQLPESFDAEKTKWNDESILKSKESVASNFRVGNELLSITIGGTNHSINVPICYPFLNKSNFSISYNNSKEAKEAIQISHNIISRVLLSLPASKTKITFIDPLELGGNASPFTPLLREIYGGRVFTQQSDIENQFSILTRAIENVIQRYLQDKFADIAEYNLKTKEVPEPYRLLIVYNFPHGFNDTIAKKLLNIIKSGPKAGVHTILINDVKAKLPYGINWDMFNGINIKNISLTNTSIVKKEKTKPLEPVIGNVYESIVKKILDFGVVVEFLPKQESLVHISELSETRINDIAKETKIKVGDFLLVKITKFDERTNKLLFSLKSIKNTDILIKAFRKNSDSFIPKNNRLFYLDQNLPHNEIVEYINKELPNSSSIKVPFTKYLPKQNEWWKESSSKSLSVPIGRHALEVQNLTFNNDDDNQALLIGKPGSGKSNLLHVIIANSICKYSPDQLEIYLIDFKGGVEFTIYADKKIPHIKTIAIESEREFGLSVLDGVERKLLSRENEFSKVGVQNIEQYHKEFPNNKMPRILLIVDEFQEFYSEDDSIKQAVDEKFDRIVRKGRAFGINTLFSSQTLSGNSIKKSTKELIDIRIALMCSDLDANQILDDRNPAAKDLTRPGQGIYNAENGRTEGNQIFQAFFIEKSDLEKTINSVVEFAKTSSYDYKNFNQIIFRGSEKALMIKENHLLKKVTPTLSPNTLKLWLGEPVAITEDVTAIIRKEGGSNLIIVGFDENIGARVMCSSIISIATQHLPNTAKFYSFNFYNIDSDLTNIPDQIFENSQQKFISIKNREVKQTLEEIKTEIEKRINDNSTNTTNIYLTFFSFQRGRAFRKDGYSMSDEGNLLSFILKEGADVGVYTLLQINSMDSFTKNLDDNLLKEFSQRVASQMNPENSVKLIGNQKASKLGDNRAWYFDDNENTMIKFKPYEFVPFNKIIEFRKPQSTLS